MGLHVVVGKGPVGTATAQELVRAGHRVRVLSRSGGTSTDVEHRAVDATDADALTAAAEGADALVNAVNPAYSRWATDWPPMAAAMLAAATRSGAVLAAMGNLYVHGRPTGPMTATTPLAATDTKGRVRARVWTDMLAAHQAGRVRVVEARASDFVGPTVPVTQSHVTRQLTTLRDGRRAWVVGDPDVLHSWAYLPDVGRVLAALATTPTTWGRPWIVPSTPPRSQRRVLTDLAAAMGARPARVSGLPWPVVHAIGAVSPQMREIAAIAHQWDADFVVDGSKTVQALGIEPTPWDEVCRATAGAVLV